MDNNEIKNAIRLGWDDMSEEYQSESLISLNDVHYAPLAAGESALRLLGVICGKRILELACGGAQNSIALAKWGADVTALDISAKQLEKAKSLISTEGVPVNLIRGDMECLGMFKNNIFDVVLSSFGWEFIPDLGKCFNECNKILNDDGILLVCTVHPLTAFEWDEPEKTLIVQDYFRPPVELWGDPSGLPNQRAITMFHSFQEMFDLLTSAGFTIERVVEPYPLAPNVAEGIETSSTPYSGLFWESQRERLSRIPFSIVYKARKVFHCK